MNSPKKMSRRERMLYNLQKMAFRKLVAMGIRQEIPRLQPRMMGPAIKHCVTLIVPVERLMPDKDGNLCIHRLSRIGHMLTSVAWEMQQGRGRAEKVVQNNLSSFLNNKPNIQDTLTIRGFVWENEGGEHHGQFTFKARDDTLHVAGGNSRLRVEPVPPPPHPEVAPVAPPPSIPIATPQPPQPPTSNAASGSSSAEVQALAPSRVLAPQPPSPPSAPAQAPASPTERVPRVVFNLEANSMHTWNRPPVQQFMWVNPKARHQFDKSVLVAELAKIGIVPIDFDSLTLPLTATSRFVFFFNVETDADARKVRDRLINEEKWAQNFHVGSLIVNRPFFSYGLEITDIIRAMVISVGCVHRREAPRANMEQKMSSDVEVAKTLKVEELAQKIVDSLTPRGQQMLVKLWLKVK